MDDHIKITYETLFELLRKEKSSADIHKVSPSFYTDVAHYIQEKMMIIEQGQHKLDLFSATERENVQQQLKNIHRILKEIYERREKKIMELALAKSITQSPLIDVTALLPEERELFEDAVHLFTQYRSKLLHNILLGKYPLATEQKADTKIVRFLNPVPKFVGKELESYGPFQEDDIANLPLKIADILIKKGSVEEIREGDAEKKFI